MTARELLKSISNLQNFIEIKKDRLIILREMAESCGTSELSGMPKSSDSSKSKIADSICKTVDLEKEIEADELRLLKLKMKLFDAIGKIDNPQQQAVLTKLYFEKLTPQQISNYMNYSVRWVYSQHKQGLKKLDSLLEIEEEEKTADYE